MIFIKKPSFGIDFLDGFIKQCLQNIRKLLINTVISMSLSSYVAQPSTTLLLENSHEDVMEGDSKLND